MWAQKSMKGKGDVERRNRRVGLRNESKERVNTLQGAHAQTIANSL